ncbi:MAG: hypothetical protein ABI760_12585 [Ferruginibacter sp.]
MKKALSYILLFVYTTLLVKPVLPFINDFASHIFNYSEHMATVHFENGKYHVHYELQQNTKKANPQKDPGILKKDVSGNEYIINKESTSLTFIHILQKPYSIFTVDMVSAFLTDDYPPPKAQVAIFIFEFNCFQLG